MHLQGLRNEYFPLIVLRNSSLSNAGKQDIKPCPHPRQFCQCRIFLYAHTDKNTHYTTHWDSLKWATIANAQVHSLVCLQLSSYCHNIKKHHKDATASRLLLENMVSLQVNHWFPPVKYHKGQ